MKVGQAGCRDGWAGWAAFVVAGLAISPWTSVAAATPSLGPLAAMSPQHRSQHVKAQAARPAQRVAAVSAELDVTPPQLTAFSVASSVDASSATNQLVVQLTVKDDLSGLDWVIVSAQGPTGQLVSSEVPQLAGKLRHIGSTGLHFSPFAEVGTWQINEVIGRDRAGNFFFYNPVQLAALGNTAFTVSNSVEDLMAPTLTGGEVLSKTVSLSKPSKGTVSQAPLLRVQLAVQDTGTTGLSGVWRAFVFMCLPDGSSCFSLGSDPMTLYGLGQATMQAQAPLAPDVAPGEYVVRDIEVIDQAGNSRLYLSTAFGGSTDFSAMLSPSTLIVKP